MPPKKRCRKVANTNDADMTSAGASDRHENGRVREIPA